MGHLIDNLQLTIDNLRIGTRGSELALAQARSVADALQAAHPGLRCELCIIRTAGDQRTDIPLSLVNKATGTGDKGVFIAAIEEELAAGRIDCAVHSLKDMPGTLDARFTLAAVLPRGPVEDVLVCREDADMEHLVVATGSVRRAHLLQSLHPGCRTVPLRGNVATRLRKLAESAEANATLLARAGLDRLGYARDAVEVAGRRLRFESLPVEQFPPALGQGAIAVETRADDPASTALAAAVDHEPTHRCIRAERRFLDLLQADCSVPVAGLATEEGGALTLRVVYYPPAGGVLRLSHTGQPGDSPESVAQCVYTQLKCTRLRPAGFAEASNVQRQSE